MLQYYKITKLGNFFYYTFETPPPCTNFGPESDFYTPEKYYGISKYGVGL